MTQVLEFALLGLGVGAVYTLLAQGLVVIYRGSGILNFAQGAFAMVGAYVYIESRKRGLAFTPAFLISLFSCAVLGLLTHLVIMRRLRNASPLMRLISTLGLLVVLEGVATLRYGATSTFVAMALPQSPVRLGSISIPQDQFWLLLIAVLLTAALAIGSRRTTFGLAITAAAENEQSAAALGWSPDVLAASTWALGSAVAAAAGILVAPLAGLSATALALLVIPAMATALLGGFTSFSLTLASGLIIGIAQSEMARYVTTVGVSDSFPFAVMLVVLLIRGRPLPIRGHVLERLPGLGTGRLRPGVIITLGGFCAVGMLTFFPTSLTIALAVQATVGLVLLSVVVVTGYAGQLSLAQLGLAGMGAFIAGRLVAAQHWPLALALVLGVVGAGGIGAVFGIPALKTRGVNLAVLTLGLGFAIQELIFNNSALTGGSVGTNVGPAHFLGINIDPITHPNRYGCFCLLWFIAAGVAVANLRRGRAGRRLASIRTNERAAASLGVSVFGTKLSAFALSSGLAGLGGILLAFGGHSIIFSNGFDPLSSTTAVGNSVIGGVGYATGPFAGSFFASGGIPSLLFNRFGSFDNWLTIIGGVSLIVVILQNPQGIVAEMSRGSDPIGRLIRRYSTRLPSRLQRNTKTSGMGAVTALTGTTTAPSDHDPAERKVLEAKGLTVRFGGVTAVADLDLTIQSGEVVGLIGPNGAGKTTVIDCLAGYVKASSGTVSFDGKVVDRLKAHERARIGVIRSFQSLELFEDLTVLENLLVAADRRDNLAYLTNLIRPDRSVLSEAAMAAVREFGLEDVLDKRPADLSYGLRRLTAIARAVATRPSVLLLDEPAAGTGESERNELRRLLRRLAGEWNLGILLVEHDVQLVVDVCDRVVAIEFGKKIAEGAPDQVRQNQRVVDAYLGTGETPQRYLAEVTKKASDD